jgi:DUF438 domain-containing protein
MHLSAIKEHIEREEDVIFPYLKKHGWDGLCLTAQSEHARIGIDIGNLAALVKSFDDIELHEFKAFLNKVVKRLSPIMLDHFSYEEEIFWPIALVVIDDTEVWNKIKSLCDEIGYCGVHV